MDYKAILAETAERKETNYIDEPGTHYLRLVGYDFFDGSPDSETEPANVVGPLFLFEVVESPAWPKGRACRRMINIMRTSGYLTPTETVRGAAVNEVRQLVRALDGAADALTAREIADILPDADAMAARFCGKVIRCYASSGGRYISLAYYPDDRE